MLLEDLPRIAVVVLGANREEDAPLFQLQQVTLEGDEGFSRRSSAELQSREPVLADNPAPERVVEVEDYALPADAELRADDSGCVTGEDRQGLERNRLFGRVPLPRAEPALLSERGSKPLAVDDADSARRGGAKSQVERLRHSLS